jgi:hypothetical protein
MAVENEFSRYTIEELKKKKKHFKRLQGMMLLLTGVSVIIISVAAATKDNMQVFQLIPFLMIAGVAFPLLVFTPIRKKIQTEIDNR